MKKVHKTRLNPFEEIVLKMAVSRHVLGEIIVRDPERFIGAPPGWLSENSGDEQNVIL
jgi:hypothetical protein